MHPLTIHPPAITTHGWLDSVQWIDGRLYIAGSALSPDGPVIDSFLVFVGGEEFSSHEVQTGLPSPYMAKFLPGAPPGSERAGFRLCVEDREARFRRIEDRLFGVLPQSEGRDGHLLLRVERPSLPVPSDEEVQTIGSWFMLGQEFLPYLVQLGKLQPEENVLDVGCGLGRMAYMLAYYLAPVAEYEGFDIVASNIEWAKRNIETRHSNFRFQLVDLCNRRYNKAGRSLVSELSFPYEENTFDFVLLSSVFTHMLTSEVCHYIDEIHRVLKPGGRVLVSSFLLDEESFFLIKHGHSSVIPRHEFDSGCWVETEDLPENAVLYERKLFLECFQDRGFEIVGDYPGACCGRRRYRSYQDLMLFVLT